MISDAIKQPLYEHFCIDANGPLIWPIHAFMEEVVVVQTYATPSATPMSLLSHSNCHISQFTPPIEVFSSILESRHYKLLNAYGHTLVPMSGRHSQCRGPHPHYDHLGLPTCGTTSPERHSRHLIKPMVLRTLFMKRCATHEPLLQQFLRCCLRLWLGAAMSILLGKYLNNEYVYSIQY